MPTRSKERESRWNGFHAESEYLNRQHILIIFTGDEKNDQNSTALMGETYLKTFGTAKWVYIDSEIVNMDGYPEVFPEYSGR